MKNQKERSGELFRGVQRIGQYTRITESSWYEPSTEY